MHYRKKEPKDEVKEKEKLIKAQKFHSALTKFLDLKKSGCLDRNLLKDIGKLLLVSPEFGTLWNYRKEILIAFKKSIDALPSELNQEQEPSPDSLDSPKVCEKQKMITEFDSACLNELTFIENCLKLSPKSYFTWHHRVWLIQFMNNPDLKKEIQLCDQCLSLDERNFHCWNYRRFIVKFGEIPAIEEFKFTTKKIVDNFSNFSSWHYRSKLYLQLVEENFDLDLLKSMVNQDFNTVTNAIFTDPNDQSPWLYFKWLIDFENSLISSKKSKSSVQKFCIADKKLIVEFTEPKAQLPLVKLKINEHEVKIDDWKSTSNCCLWFGKIDVEVDSNPEFTLQIDEEQIVKSSNGTSDCFLYIQPNSISEKSKNSNQRIQDLKILLEIESNAKWPNYMLAMLDQTDCFDQKLDSLMEIDPLRTNFYNDLRSKSTLQKKLPSSITEFKRHLNLSSMNLHSLHLMNNLFHLQYLDLSKNNLIHLGQSFLPLLLLKCLILDQNQIYYCDKRLHFDNLEILSLKGNKIDDENVVETILQISPKLRHVNLIGNPISDSLDLKSSLNNIQIYQTLEQEQQFEKFRENELLFIEENKIAVL